MGWLVGHRWAPHRQDSLRLEFGMLRMSLPLVLSVDCVCGRTSRYILDIGKYRFLYFPNRTLIAFIKGPLLNPAGTGVAVCAWSSGIVVKVKSKPRTKVLEKVPEDFIFCLVGFGDSHKLNVVRHCLCNSQEYLSPSLLGRYSIFIVLSCSPVSHDNGCQTDFKFRFSHWSLPVSSASILTLQ
jgi:hypothetical protein